MSRLSGPFHDIKRINGLVFNQYLEMEIISGRSAGFTDSADLQCGLYFLPFFHHDSVKMRVTGDEAIIMLDFNQFPIASFFAGKKDYPIA